MKTQIEITCVVDDEADVGTIIYLLDTAGVSDARLRSVTHYGDWKDGLPKEAVPGLSDECLEWIRYWGKGGGDYSSEICIRSAIEELMSDIPAELADAIHGSVTDYSKSGFEATGLTIQMINECIEELQECEGRNDRV